MGMDADGFQIRVTLTRKNDWNEIRRILEKVWSDCCKFKSGSEGAELGEFLKTNVDGADADIFSRKKKCNHNGCGKSSENLLNQMILTLNPYSCNWHDGELIEEPVGSGRMNWSCCDNSSTVNVYPPKLRFNSYDLDFDGKAKREPMYRHCKKTAHCFSKEDDYVYDGDRLYVPFFVWLVRISELGGGFVEDANRLFTSQFRTNRECGLATTLREIVFFLDKTEFSKFKKILRRKTSRMQSVEDDNYAFKMSSDVGRSGAMDYSFSVQRKEENEGGGFAIQKMFWTTLHRGEKERIEVDLSLAFLVFSLSEPHY